MLRNLYLHYARQDWQGGKKPERKSPNLCDQNIKKQRTKIWKERNIDPDFIQIVYRNQNKIRMKFVLKHSHTKIRMKSR